MQSRRTAKIGQAILEQVSTTILFDLKDPRIENVTVTHVEVSPDVQSAKVYISIMGEEANQELCLRGLKSARGYIQSKVADRIQTRYTPILTFVKDSGAEKSFEATRILNELSREKTCEQKTQTDPESNSSTQTHTDPDRDG